MYKYIILGSGKQGTAIAYDLARFGDASKIVLADVNIDIAKGKSVGLIGKSGSGKSTLLNCINFLEPFEAGTIRIDEEWVGYTVNEKSERIRQPETQINRMRTRVGMVFQQFNLFPHLSILGNITLAPRKVKRMKKDEKG